MDVQYLTSIAQNASTTYWSIPVDSQDPFLDWVIAVASSAQPPLVHSISYGAVEHLVPAEHMTRFSLEACKLSLRGVTIVVSSGDDGVANYLAKDDQAQCKLTKIRPKLISFQVASHLLSPPHVPMFSLSELHKVLRWVIPQKGPALQMQGVKLQQVADFPASFPCPRGNAMQYTNTCTLEIRQTYRPSRNSPSPEGATPTSPPWDTHTKSE